MYTPKKVFAKFSTFQNTCYNTFQISESRHKLPTNNLLHTMKKNDRGSSEPIKWQRNTANQKDNVYGNVLAS